MTIPYAETKYGFQYGAADISRAFSDEKKGWVVLILKTPKHPRGLQIYVTKTGKVRINGEGEEWKPEQMFEDRPELSAAREKL